MNKIHSIKELKTGDVVVFRNSLSGVVIKDLNTIVMINGFTNLDSRKSFKSDTSMGFDILRVYRPESAKECRFYNSDIHNDSNIIYNASDPETSFYDSLLEEALNTPTLYCMTPDKLVWEVVSESDNISLHVYCHKDKYYILAYRGSNNVLFRECTKDEIAVVETRKGLSST